MSEHDHSPRPCPSLRPLRWPCRPVPSGERRELPRVTRHIRRARCLRVRVMPAGGQRRLPAVSHCAGPRGGARERRARLGQRAAKEIAGTEDPRIAILRPADDGGVSQTVVASAGAGELAQRCPAEGRGTASAGAAGRRDRLPLPDRRGGPRRQDAHTPRRRGPCPSRSRVGRCGMDAGTVSSCSSTRWSSPTSTKTDSATSRRTRTAAGWGWTGGRLVRDYQAGDELDEDFDEERASRPRRRALAVLDLDRLRGWPRHVAGPGPEGRTRDRRRHAARQPAYGAGPFLTRP
jgi:hypothetical protein